MYAAAKLKHLARKYDSCFLKWYSESMASTLSYTLHDALMEGTEYLRGNSSEDECAPLFKKYKSCLTVRKALHCSRSILILNQKALREKGLDGMLSEAQDSTRSETDAEHLKRS